MCDHYASCAIVQDNGLSAAFTIAHELGHVLNMPHDDDYKCQSFVDRKGSASGQVDDESGEDTRGRNEHKREIQHYVMSRMLDHNTYPWAWSRCSRHFLTEFLDAGHGYCLEDKPDSNLLYNDDENSVDDESLSSSLQQPGEIFSEHKQCELVFGPNSQLCSYMPPCRRLWCTNHGGPESEESEGCRTQHMPWADGTRCGANKWCQRGQCVLKDLEKLKIINGDWGGWQDYGECSRDCGGGVRKSFRECDNPKPKNGGKYCVGPRVKYESCNTHECANTSVSFDFRASQCAAFNGDNFNINGLPEDVTWVPKYNGISPKDMCKLFCRVQGSSSYYLLKEKVIDGTPCGIDTHLRRVRRGRLDVHNIPGLVQQHKVRYNTVVTIPSGASNIDIRQRSYDNSARDDNYLALLDPITSEYVLNGHFVVSMFRKTIHYGGSVLEYSGSDQIVERINSSSRPLKRDLEIRILSVGKLKPPDIVFQYVISSDNKTAEIHTYEWIPKMESSTTCSSVCNGTTVPYTFECVRRSNSRVTVVQASFCDSETPRYESKPCNTHCTLAYRLVCPESCSRNHTTECVRTEQASKVEVHAVVRVQRAGVKRRQVRSAANVTGYQIRNVWCQRFNWRSLVDSSVDNYEVVDDRECLPDKPVSRRNCRLPEQANAICGEWKIDQWSPCFETCGPGRTRALYACMLSSYQSSQILPPDYCVHVSKPIVERPCEVIPCARYTNTNWSDCDCDRNTQTRNITCMVNNSPSPNTSVCERLNIMMPKHSRECVESCKYKVSAWSDDCRLYTGKVYRYRSVTCDYSSCTGPAPNSMQECGDWVEGTWSGCNTSWLHWGRDAGSVGCYVRASGSTTRSAWGSSKINRSTRESATTRTTALKTELGVYAWAGGRGGVRGSRKDPNPYYAYNVDPALHASIHVRFWALGLLHSRLRVALHGREAPAVQEEQTSQVCHESGAPRAHPVSARSQSPQTENCNENKSILQGVKTRAIECVLDTTGLVVNANQCTLHRTPLKPARCGTAWRRTRRLATCPTSGSWATGLVASLTSGSVGRGGSQDKCPVSGSGNTLKLMFPGTTAANGRPGRGPSPGGPRESKSALAHARTTSKHNTSSGSPPAVLPRLWRVRSLVAQSDVPQDEQARVDRPEPLPHSIASQNNTNYCPPPKPKEYDYCMVSETCDELPPTPNYTWDSTPWTTCNCPNSTDLTRSSSIQKRKVFCTQISSGSKRNEGRARENFMQVVDGDYHIVRWRATVKIYCHGMTDLGKPPKEYVTVSEDHNYSEIYEKRLIRPETCPRNGTRMSSASAFSTGSGGSGSPGGAKSDSTSPIFRLTFRALISGPDIVRDSGGLLLVVNELPQGRFAIDLRSTGFAVSSLTSWSTSGHRATMRVVRKNFGGNSLSQYIQGKCGGYCGTCAVSKNIGLRVDVI
ncbi:A disintegrin and metalloproteinase with thrombospondin motifs 9 [Orchesella cincta]|uniref:A disintegrin and metalloproteinase with thrombospondin motifs 9 n=1 Tax=Orchesella cincta TaxID=48709 RepID=A0A1D2M4I2_ORCCI|nr:A disintegrin and metalloproteinase with thrombospondin motifs 9 [Orchesella cincta]